MAGAAGMNSIRGGRAGRKGKGRHGRQMSQSKLQGGVVSLANAGVRWGKGRQVGW